MTDQKDGSGNIYFDVGNIRVTAIPDTWNKCPEELGFKLIRRVVAFFKELNYQFQTRR